MRTTLVIMLALAAGFLAGMMLSEFIAIGGYLLFHRAVGIKYLPVIFPVGCAGSALLVDRLVSRRAKRPPSAPIVRGSL